MKKKYILIIIYLFILNTFSSCKGQEKEKKQTITDNHITIINSGVYYYTPSLKKIDSLKKSMGEDKFYIIADDSNAYFSEISQKLDDNLIKLKSKYVYFKNDNIRLNIDSLSNNWGIIEYVKGRKPKIFSFVDYNLFLNNRTANDNSVENNDKIRIDNSSLFVNKEEYKDLIKNEMSLTTSLKIVDEKRFILTYEYNASSIKQKQVYSFICKDNTIYLTSKEILKYSKEGSVSNKIYLKNYKLTNQSYNELEGIGNLLKDTFLENNSEAAINLFNDVYQKIGSINCTITNEDRFISTTLNEDKFIKNIKILDINKLNDVAYYLEQTGAYYESMYLLKEILKKDPNRVVAWLNLADAQWGNGEKKDAKSSYQKYISLMKYQKKDLKKIPQRVYDRSK